MKLQKLYSIIFLLFFLSSIVYVNISIADGDEDETKESEKDKTDNETSDSDKDNDEEKEKEKRDAYEREVEVENEKDEIKIKSELKNGENKDKIVFKLKAEDGPEFSLKYSSSTTEVKDEMKFRVKFRSLVEYKENGTTTGYQDGEEISEYKFKKDQFSDILYEKITNGTDITHIFTLSTTDGVFTVIMMLSGSLVETANATLTPNSVKIDVVINDFPYTSNGSSLALETRLKTQFERKIKSDTEEETVGLSTDETAVGFGNTGFFSWANTADADGNIIDVISSTIKELDSDDEDENDLEENETTEKIWFSFIVKDANKIYWDPKVGVVSEGTAQLLDSITAVNGLPGFELYIAIVSFIFVLSISMKRKK